MKPQVLRPLNKILPNRFRLYLGDYWEDVWDELVISIFYARQRTKPEVSDEIRNHCILTAKCWNLNTHKKYIYKCKRVLCWIRKHKALTCRGLGGIRHCIYCHQNL